MTGFEGKNDVSFFVSQGRRRRTMSLSAEKLVPERINSV